MAESVEISLKSTTADQAAIRKQFADAGFRMVEGDELGLLLEVHGMPSIYTGLASKCNVAVDHNRGVAIFTEL